MANITVTETTDGITATATTTLTEEEREASGSILIDDLDAVQELLTLLIADNADFDSAWLDVIKDVAERYDRSLLVVKKLIEDRG